MYPYLKNLKSHRVDRPRIVAMFAGTAFAVVVGICAKPFYHLDLVDTCSADSWVEMVDLRTNDCAYRADHFRSSAR